MRLSASERRRHANLPFDARPLPSTSIADLDVDRFRGELLPQLVAADVLAANQRSVEHQLTALHLLTPDDHATPTGMLFVGRDPLAHLPGACVQFLRIDGASLADPILSSHTVSGSMTQVLLEIEEIVRGHIDTAVSFVGIRQDARRPTVPFESLQQLTRNALMHRIYEASNAPVRVTWFADRVEIASPGGPFGQVTMETFGTPGITDYRNPTIAGTLARLGYVQRFGVGLAVAAELLQRNGNSPFEANASAATVLMTVRLLR